MVFQLFRRAFSVLTDLSQQFIRVVMTAVSNDKKSFGNSYLVETKQLPKRSSKFCAPARGNLIIGQVQISAGHKPIIESENFDPR